MIELKKMKATALSVKLREAADALRSGRTDAELALILDDLAGAAAAPTGYTLRVLGAIDHETFLPTQEGAMNAAADIGYAQSEYSVVPLIAVPGPDPEAG